MIIRLVAATMLFAFQACVVSAQESPIVKRMQAFADAYNARDAKAIGGFYLEKGALLPPRGRVLVGREAIAAHYAQAFAGGASELKYRILEIDQTGPGTAIEIGETQVRLGKQTISGRYIHVWKRRGDTWSLWRDMYHVLGVHGG